MIWRINATARDGNRLDRNRRVVRHARDANQANRIILPPGLESRAGNHQGAVIVTLILVVDVVEMHGMLMLMAVNDHCDAAIAEKPSYLLKIGNVGECLQLLAQARRAKMVVKHGDP